MSPFRSQTTSLRRFSRFSPFLNSPSLEAKSDYAPFILFSSGVSIDTAGEIRVRSVRKRRPYADFPVFFPVSQFTLSRGKIRLCTFYTFLIGGVHRYCTRNLSPFRPQTSSLRLFSRFFPVSQFTLSRGKIRLCTFYTFLIGGVHRYCTRNLSPFRPQTSSLRLFSRFFPVSQFILSRGKIRLCTSYTFSSRVSIDTAGGGI